MPACPACNASNPEGYRFCGQCGTKLAVAQCPSCGAPSLGGERFCGQCGSDLEPTASHPRQPLAPEAVRPLAERKLATVVFADVVGFTSLSERTDHELVARMVDAAFRDLGSVVAEHGGSVDKYMGDSVMAVFGVPVAHDDDAERAVAAALAIRQLGGDLVFSIGINSGEVMVTTVGRGDMTVIGDTVNVAARLEKAAAPGEVLCGRLTTELAGTRVKFRLRQPVLLKGKSEPVEVWEATALRDAERGEQIDDLPLVGRDTEFAFLEAQWRRTRDDLQKGIVVLCGEAGSGKTRILNELTRAVGAQGLVVRSAYPGYGAMGGARLAADVVSQLGTSGDDEVDSRVRSVAGDVDEPLRSMDPPALHQEQLWAFGRLFKHKAKERPLLLMIDDMHRSDDRTLELVAELDSKLTGIPLLTVLSGRTEPGRWLSRFPAATTVRVAPLGRTQAAALANGFVREKPLAPEAVGFLVDLASGNPLYLRELVSMARAQGMLVDDGAEYRLTATAGVPATLQALLAARLDSLDPAQKQAVQLAAVLGEASVEQIESLGVLGASAVLESGVASGYFARAAHDRYVVSDSLLREVAYEMLPRNLRGDLHRRASELVSRPEDRARHLDQAARYLNEDRQVAGQASEALAEVGQAFIGASRHLDAMRLLERSVALGMRRPSVLIELAKVQSNCGKADEALETLNLIEDDPDDPRVAVERDHTAAFSKLFVDPAWSLRGLEDVMDRWRSLGDTTKEAWAHANAGVANFNLGRMDHAAKELEFALEMFEQAGDRFGAIASSSFLCLAKPADPRVDRWLEEALEFADESGDRSRQITTLAALSWKNFMTGLFGSAQDMEEAAQAARRLAELAEELGATDMALHGRALLAIMARQTGQLDEARAQVAKVQSFARTASDYGTWLGWATSFSVAVASGASGAAPPFPPDTSRDPVVAMAGLIIESELIFAGRLDEAIARFENAGPPAFDSPLAEVGVMFYALALVLAGRGAEAGPWIERAVGAARTLQARSATLTASALSAEILHDLSLLPSARLSPMSITGALAMRARAVAGDLDATRELRRVCASLAMPGLLAGVGLAVVGESRGGENPSETRD